MGNPAWGFFWFIILITFGLGISSMAAALYIIIYPLTVCIPSLQGLTDFLLLGIQFSHYCTRAMMDCQALC